MNKLTDDEAADHPRIFTNLTGETTEISARDSHNLPMGKRGFSLPQPWEDAISGWTLWLRISGKRDATIDLRRDHVRSIARRSRTSHPGEITLSCLVTLCSERPWSPEHRKGVRVSLVSFYDWALQNAVVQDNPAARLPKVKTPPPAPRPAPDDIWLELLAAAAPRERLMARLAAEAGLRRSEVALVAADDLIRDLHGWSLIVHGKGGKQRVVPLNDGLVAEFRAAATRRGYLFPGQVDGHLSARWVGTMISKMMPRGWSMHKLRHRFATLGYSGTGNLRAVQEALGHASVATTQRYTAVSTTDVRSVIDAAAHRLAPSGARQPDAPTVPLRAMRSAAPAVRVATAGQPSIQIDQLSWPPAKPDHRLTG